MKPLLASLADLKNALPPEGPALLLDVDGTISAIAPTPQEATVDPGCKRALQALAVGAQHPSTELRTGTAPLPLVAAISGRPAAEVAAMVGVAGMVYVGNHGLERWQDGEEWTDPRVGAQHPSTKLSPRRVALRRRVAWATFGDRTGAVSLRHAIDAALRQLQERLSLSTGSRPGESLSEGESPGRPSETGQALLGVVYEHKGLTASVHYRLSPDPARARQAILKAARDVAGPLPLHVREGRMVVELRPAIKADKGTAVAALLEEYQLRPSADASRPAAAFYLGDDLTDVDAFKAIHRWAQGPVLSPQVAQATRLRRATRRGESLVEGPVLSGVEGPGRWGAAVAVLSAETPRQLREEGDFWLEGVEEVRQFLEWLAATCRAYAPPAEVR